MVRYLIPQAHRTIQNKIYIGVAELQAPWGPCPEREEQSTHDEMHDQAIIRDCFAFLGGAVDILMGATAIMNGHSELLRNMADLGGGAVFASNYGALFPLHVA